MICRNNELKTVKTNKTGKPKPPFETVKPLPKEPLACFWKVDLNRLQKAWHAPPAVHSCLRKRYAYQHLFWFRFSPRLDQQQS